MPDQDLEVALIPLDIVEADAPANIRNIEQRLATLDRKVDLVVLPELCFSGFMNDPRFFETIAEPNDGECMQAVMRWSKQYDIAICGGFAAKDADGRLYNRGFLALPGETPLFYNKRHLFCLGGESDVFTPGRSQSPTVMFRSWKLRMTICYDLRFPVWCRCKKLDYDVLIVPSNWPNSRFNVWDTLLRARAMENQAYVIGCDREGADAYGKYVRGDSMILDTWGHVISSTADDGTVYGTLRADAFNQARTSFTPWRDADDFTIKL